jgi:hypothetical protein
LNLLHVLHAIKRGTTTLCTKGRCDTARAGFVLISCVGHVFAATKPASHTVSALKASNAAAQHLTLLQGANRQLLPGTLQGNWLQQELEQEQHGKWV